jgi:hypothetical protein
MSEVVSAMIADCEGRIAALTDMLEKLRWFQREFPHTAAAIVPVAEPRRKYTRRVVVAKPKKQRAQKRTDARSAPSSAKEPP